MSSYIHDLTLTGFDQRKRKLERERERKKDRDHPEHSGRVSRGQEGGMSLTAKSITILVDSSARGVHHALPMGATHVIELAQSHSGSHSPPPPQPPPPWTSLIRTSNVPATSAV